MSISKQEDIHEVKCSKHEEHATELYCFKHKHMCCVHCVIEDHQLCETVKLVDVDKNILYDAKDNTYLSALRDDKHELEQIGHKLIEMWLKWKQSRDSCRAEILDFRKEINLRLKGLQMKLDDDVNTLHKRTVDSKLGDSIREKVIAKITELENYKKNNSSGRMFVALQTLEQEMADMQTMLQHFKSTLAVKTYEFIADKQIRSSMFHDVSSFGELQEITSGNKMDESFKEVDQSGKERDQSDTEGNDSGSEVVQSGSEGYHTGNEVDQSGKEVYQNGSQEGQNGSEVDNSDKEVDQSGSQDGQNGSEGAKSDKEVDDQSGSQEGQNGSEGDKSGTEVDQSGSQEGNEMEQRNTEVDRSGKERDQSGSERCQSNEEVNQNGKEVDKSGSEEGQNGSGDDKSGKEVDQSGSQEGQKGSKDDKSGKEVDQKGSEKDQSGNEMDKSGKVVDQSGSEDKSFPSQENKVLEEIKVRN